MALLRRKCKECGGDDTSGLHLHVEIENLKQRLLEREHHIVTMETNFLNEADKFPNGEFSALTEELLTWQEKYARLYESHKRVQKVNQSLEDKLLRIVDKFETEKTALTRDLSNVTQRLVDSRSKIKQLEDENERYRNDVNLAIQLVQCKPTNFVAQKLDSLSPELQHQVRTYVCGKRPESNGNVALKPEAKIIKVPIPTFPPTAMVYSLDKQSTQDKEDVACNQDIVSAAIMAKILEERARERLVTKHCDSCTCSSQLHRGVDSSTQTPAISYGPFATHELHSNSHNVQDGQDVVLNNIKHTDSQNSVRFGPLLGGLDDAQDQSADTQDRKPAGRQDAVRFGPLLGNHESRNLKSEDVLLHNLRNGRGSMRLGEPTDDIPAGLSHKGRDILFGRVDESKTEVKARSRESRTFLSAEPERRRTGPRACSLRMQAGSSNILLANATCYTPVLYTSPRVHSPRGDSGTAED